MKTTFDPRVNDVRCVDAEAFRAGANGVPMESGIKEIAALFARRKAELEERAAPVLKALEAQAKTLREHAEEAATRWEVLKEKHGNDVPRLFKPIFLLVASVGAVVAEAVLLAPMLDMVGIADPQHQLWTAVGIIAAASGLVHLCLERREQRPDARWPLVITGAVVVGLALVGLFRADQMAFAAMASGSLFGEFLRQHPWLRAAVMVFLTLLFPIAATLIPHACFDELHNWWQYRKARRLATKLSRNADLAEKRLEGQQEELQHQLAELDERATEWKASYESFYELGKEVGARQRPRWTVWAKAGAVGGLGFLGPVVAQYFLGVLSPALLGASALLAGSLGLASGAYFHRRWAHPPAKEYLELANLQFRDPVARGEQAQLPAIATGDDRIPAERLPERVCIPSTEKALPYGADGEERLREVS